MKIWIVAIVALVPVAMTGCASEEPVPTGPSWDSGVIWVLDADTIATLAPGAPSTARVTIAFAEGEVGGTAACNSYGGTYQAGSPSGDDLTIEVGQMTEMACEEPLMELETSFVEALGEVTTFGEADGVLILTGEATTLTFTEEPPAEPLPLTGTTWRLESVASGDAVSTTIAGTQATLVLAEDGTASGNATCNTFSGSYEVEGETLTFGPVATTRMACTEMGASEQEAAVLTALEATRSFAIDGDVLSLAGVNPAMLLQYRGT